MSKPRYNWWPYVCRVVQDYPALRCRAEEAMETRTTASLDGQPRGGGISNPTERAVIRAMSGTDYRDMEAVERAIEQTKHMRWGKQRLDLLRMVYWDKTHTLQGAAITVPCGIKMARQWSVEFKYLVAHYMGLEK